MFNRQEWQRKYWKSKKGKEVNKRYEQSPKGKATARKYRQSKKGKLTRKKARLKHIYNINLEYYNKLLTKQNNRCAICNKLETKKTNKRTIRELSVDHDHRTNKVRGLLCDNCNNLLGRAQDKIEILKNAIRYLRKNNAQLNRDILD